MAINPENSYFEQQWHLKIIKAPEAYALLRSYSAAEGDALGSPDDRTFGRAQVFIAVIDQGIQTSGGVPVNEAFKGVVSDGNDRLAAVYDFLRKDASDQYTFSDHDVVGGSHGVACASVALGAVRYTGAYLSDSAIAGVAGNCRLIGLRWGIGSNEPLAMIWACNLVDLGYFRSKYQNVIPQGAAYRLPANVSMDVLSRSITVSDFVGEAFAASAFGRKGRGVLLFNAYGNDNEDTISADFDRRWNIVGATKVDNGLVNFNTEAKAGYSNFGDRMDFCAPAGGSQLDLGSDENRTLVSSVLDGGTFDDTGSSADWNVTLTKITNTKYLVAPDDTLGITKGHYVEIGAPNSTHYQIREIKSVTVGPNVLEIEISSSFNSFGGAINLLSVAARISYSFAETTAALSLGTLTIPLNSTVGFRSGQKVFIDDGPNRELVTVSTVSASDITLVTGVAFQHNTVPVRVTKGSYSTSILSRVKNETSSTIFKVSSAQGFFVGQLIRLDVTVNDPNGNFPVNEIYSVTSVDTVNNQIGVHVTIKSPTTGSIEALGGGEYNSTFNGTSSACPHAAGVGALALSASQYSLNWLEVKHIMHETAMKVDLLNTNPDGKWKDESGNPVFGGGLSLAGVTIDTTLSTAFAGNANTLELVSVAGMQKEMVIKVSGGGNTSYAAITKVDTGTNTITVDRNIIPAYPTATVKVGRKAHRSKWYGRGRVDAERAVEMARSWNVNDRDLWIKDFAADTGVAHTMPAAIDSPDIWVRNTNPATDTNYATPELPDTYADSWIYVRVRNRGTQASLPNSEVALSLTDTLDPTFGIDFAFPDRWIPGYNPGNLAFNEITAMLSLNYGFILTTYTKDGSYNDQAKGHVYKAPYFPFANNPLLPVQMADPAKPHILPSIPAGGEYVAIFPWPSKIKAHRPIGRTFIKAHITPFDGDDSVAGPDVQSNNNLSFRQILFTKIELNDASTLAPLTSVEVDTLGTTVLQSITILVQNILPAYVNNISIKMTMKLTDGSPDEVCEFKYNGANWVPVNPFPAWVTLSAPILAGSNAPYQEHTMFNGNLVVSNLYGKLTTDVTVTDGTNTVLHRIIELPLQAVSPSHPDGAAGTDSFLFHTFTDFDQLPNQAAANKYGPISPTEYRTAAMFTGIASGTNLKAYAVTRGRIAMQEVTGSPHLINLILQPDDQPDSDYGRIKYFVYRGIKFSSYLAAIGGAVKADNPVANNDFLDRHWALRNILDAKELALDPMYVSPGVKRDDLGLATLPAVQLGTTKISELFNTDRFQIATRGWEIGEFDTSGLYGFQIIVDGPYHEPVLDDVRTLDPIVTITYVPGQPEYALNQREDISTLLKREQILSYMDPAAFLGQSYEFVRVKTSGSPTPVKISLYAELYDDVLVKFATRDKVYVDIRNEVNHSLNFFGNYGGATPPNLATVKFLDATNAYVDKDYDASGWPILILNAPDFPAGTASFRVKLGLKFPTGDNADPMLYIPNVQTFDPPKDNPKLQFKKLTPGATHTSEVELAIEYHSVGSVVLPTAVKVSYAKRYDLSALPPAVFPTTKIIRDDIWDTIFAPGDITLVPRTNHAVWDSRSELRYSGWTSKKDFDFALQTGRAVDDIGEVAYAFVHGPAELQTETSNSISHVNVDLINGSVQARSFLEHLAKKKLASVKYELIDENPTSFPCLRVQAKEGNHSTRKIKPSANDIVLYAYTAAEKTIIDNAINAANFLPGSSRYYMSQAHKLKKNLFSHPYFEMELAVQGIVYNAGAFTYQVIMIPTGVMLYSVDGRSYFSTAYATAVQAQLPY